MNDPSEIATDRESAILLAPGLFSTVFAKTAHGLVRGPSRWPVAAVVDAELAGRDAREVLGEPLDREPGAIPIVSSLTEALSFEPRPTHCVVGVATIGGVLPDAVRRLLLEAAEAGLVLVAGLHQRLGDDPALRQATSAGGGSIIDLRQPPEPLHFFTGEIFDCPIPRVAVLGTDCAVGKRTTTSLLVRELGNLGLRAEMIATGQTGWLQGARYGFVLDSTPNDFVCGELEHQIVRCWREAPPGEEPEVLVIEGQSGLRNPSGPCGSELLLSAAPAGVVLQHPLGRTHYEGLEAADCRLPSVASEVELIERYGPPVWAVTLHHGGFDTTTVAAERARLEQELGRPVLVPIAPPSGAEELASHGLSNHGLSNHGLARLATLVSRHLQDLAS